MGSGASVYVEPYLDSDTASLSNESTDESMDTAFLDEDLSIADDLSNADDLSIADLSNDREFFLSQMF